MSTSKCLVFWSNGRSGSLWCNCVFLILRDHLSLSTLDNIFVSIEALLQLCIFISYHIPLEIQHFFYVLLSIKSLATTHMRIQKAQCMTTWPYWLYLWKSDSGVNLSFGMLEDFWVLWWWLARCFLKSMNGMTSVIFVFCALFVNNSTVKMFGIMCFSRSAAILFSQLSFLCLFCWIKTRITFVER